MTPLNSPLPPLPLPVVWPRTSSPTYAHPPLAPPHSPTRLLPIAVVLVTLLSLCLTVAYLPLSSPIDISSLVVLDPLSFFNITSSEPAPALVLSTWQPTARPILLPTPPTPQPSFHPTHSPLPRSGLEVPLLDTSIPAMVLASAMSFDPNLVKALPPERLSRSIAHRPLCQGEFGILCHPWNYSANSLHAWRTKQNAQRAQYAHTRHPLCPKTPDDYVTIASFVGWPRRDDSLLACPVKCRVTSNISPETTIYVEEPVVHPRKAPHPVLSALLCLEPECNFPKPYVRDATWGGIENAEMLLNFDRGTDAPVTYADGWTSYGNCRDRNYDPPDLTAIDKCLPPAPTLESVANKKFATAMIGNCGRPGRRRLDWAETFKHSGWSTGHGRRRFFERLQMYLKSKGSRTVDSYGACLHTPGLSLPNTGGADRYRVQVDIIKNYKFHLAFENLIIPDYLTEKQWVGVFGGAVPVVLGDDVDFTPGGKGSYISALDFSGPEALGQYLLELDANHTRYLEYFKWRQQPVKDVFKANVVHGFSYHGAISWPCRLCQRYLREFCSAPDKNATDA